MNDSAGQGEPPPVATAATLMFRFDAPVDGPITLGSACEMFPLVFDQSLGRGIEPVLRRIAAADRHRFEESLATACRDGTPWRCETGGLGFATEPLVLQWSGLPERGPEGGTAMYGQMAMKTGVTAPGGGQEVLIAELHRTLNALQDFSRSVSDWYWESDVDGHFTYMSESFRDAMGEDPRAYYGKRRDDVMLRYDDPAAAEEILERIRLHQPFRDLQFERTSVSGEPVWVRASGVPIFDADGTFRGYRGAGSNVTELLQSRERGKLLASLVEKLPIGLSLLDADMRFAAYNRTMQEVSAIQDIDMAPGMAYADLLAQTIERGSTVHEEVDDETWIRKRIETVRTEPTRIERHLGDRVFEFRSYPIDNGKVVFYCTDITETKQLQEMLAHAQRVEAMGRLTAGVAHDFNNLLAVILGNLELLTLAGDEADRRPMIADALTATRRGAELTRQLLAFGQRTTLMPVTLDPGEVVRAMYPMLRRTLPELIDIVIDRQTARPIDVDRAQLESAILNLALNARDAMPRGGRLTYTLSEHVVTREGVPGIDPALAPGSYLEISVADTGVGMAPDTAEHAFDPFFTTKNFGEGSGLGLSMVAGFVAQSGGGAGLRTKEGAGTEVRLFFPARALGQKRVPELATDAPQPAARRGRTVLLVEDAEDVRRMLVASLGRMGHIVLEAPEANEALEMLASGIELDLLISDIGLPGPVQGVELVRRALEARPGLPAILVSGYPEAAAESGGLPDGVPLLLKPVLLADFTATVERALS